MKFRKKLIIAISILITLGLVGTAMAVYYFEHTPISSVSITSHSDGDVVFANQDYTVECTTSTDRDSWCENEVWHYVWDNVTHTWSGDGQFDPPGTGTSLTWSAPTNAGSATITVTVDDQGYPLYYNSPSNSDSVTLTVLKVSTVEVHTTSSYNDNSGSGLTDGQVHFGHKDGSGSYAYPDLYIEVSMDGGDSNQVDQFTLPVISDSDTNGINVDFTETGANTDIYRCDNPIHLSTASSQANLELEVIDEETLTVGYKAGPEVDRGEVATLTAALGGLQSYADGGADAIDHFLDKDEGSDPDPYYWWDNGESRAEGTRSDFGDFIKEVSSSTIHGDFLFQCSHGNQGNIGYMGGIPSIYKPTGGTPTITSTDWEKDIEWAIFYSCHVLGQYRSSSPSEFTDEWDNALVRQSDENNVHGIMASCDVLWAAPTEDHMLEFCDQIKGNSTKIINAYMDSAIDDSVVPNQWNASVLAHDDNRDDYLNNMTKDTTNPRMYYTYYGTFDPNDDPNWPDPNDPNRWSGVCYAGSGQGCKVLCDIPTDQPELTKVAVCKETLDTRKLDYADFDGVTFGQAGRVIFKRAVLDQGPISLSRPEAETIAAAFIAQKGGGIPADAELAQVWCQLEGTYDAMDPANTRTTHIKKALLEYRHKINGIEIVGDNRGDSIFVTFSDDQIIGLNRHWRNIVGPTGTAQEVISADDALDVAIENIPRVIILPPDESYAITEIDLFYYGLPSEAKDQTLTPAWGFQVNGRLWVYVDAFTAEFLR